MAIGVTDIVKSAGSALTPVGQTLSDTWSALIGDRVTAWRLKNAAALQRQVDAKVSALGLKLDSAKVPERYAITWFEEATKQDETSIQDLFATLLVKAATGDTDASDRRLLEIVTRFTPEDATAFEWFFGKTPATKYPVQGEFAAWKTIMVELGERSWLAIEHLMVLGVLERRFDSVQKDSPYYGSNTDYWTANAEISATELGMSLHRALCGRAPSAFP